MNSTLLLHIVSNRKKGLAFEISIMFHSNFSLTYIILVMNFERINNKRAVHTCCNVKRTPIKSHLGCVILKV